MSEPDHDRPRITALFNRRTTAGTEFAGRATGLGDVRPDRFVGGDCQPER
jgi:hypothetical protein